MRISSLFLGLLAVCFTTAAVTKEQFINDLNTLNYALALENFESALYAAFLNKFPTAASAGVSPQLYEYLKQAGEAEANHASAISGVLTAAKWIPAPACNFTSVFASFGDNVQDWLGNITVVENVGAQAYTYATQYLTFNGYLQYAATVATVEARHASFLNALTGQNSFPAAVEGGLSLAQVLSPSVAGGFFTSCPKSAPTVCFDGVTRNFSVLDHAPGAPYAPRLANSLRTNAVTGTYALNGAGQAFNAADPKLTAAAYARDTLVLQYALTAENLEAAFYVYALNNVSEATFAAYFDTVNPLPTVFSSSYVYGLLRNISAHETGHVNTLNSVLSGRGTSGVPACTYPGNFTEFGFNGTAAGFLTAAKALENAGVGAYLGAITLLTDVNLVNVAASVALVEARHAAYLQFLTKQAGLLPGSNQNTDTPIFPDAVAALVAPALGTCPPITTPDTLNGGTYSSLTLPYADLAAVAKDAAKTGGYGDAAAYNPSSTSSSTGQTTTNTNSPRNSAGSLFVSFALMVSVALFAF